VNKVKKQIIYSLIFVLFFFLKSSAAKDGQTVRLVKSVDTRQLAWDWKWRVSDDNKIYPYIKITSDKIEFLDPEGTILNYFSSLPHYRLVTSDNQQFAAFVQRKGKIVNYEEYQERKFFTLRITDFSGREIFTIDIDLHYDDPIPGLILSNQGKVILLDGAAGEVKIFENDNDPINVVDLFDDDEFNYEKPIHCAINDSGDRFAVIAQKRPASYDEETFEAISGDPYLFYFDESGEEIWRIPIDSPTVSRVAISPSGKFIVVAHYSPGMKGDPILHTTIFNEAGKKIVDLPLLFRLARFSSDEDQLFVIDKKRMGIVEIDKKIYQIVNLIEKASNRMIIDLKNDAKKNPLIVTARSVFQNGRFEYAEPELVKMTQSGVAIWSLKFDEDIMIFPSIYLKGNQIAIGFQHNFKLYKEERE